MRSVARGVWTGVALTFSVAACAQPARHPTVAAPHMYPAPASPCPAPTHWDGRACVLPYVVTDVRCPTGSLWNGGACQATHVVCPPGARWIKGECVASVVVRDREIIENNPADVANVSREDEIFEDRAPVADETAKPSPYENR